MIETSLYEQIIIAGFGGQGVILAGKLLAQTGMTAGHEVTYMPSYGAEVRGGTANSMVVIADEPIASPLVTIPDVAIILNAASFHKFTPRLKSGGLLILNSSMIQETVERDDIEVVAVPVDDIANSLNSPRSANMAAIGAYLQKRGFINPDLAAQCLPEVLAQRYHKTIPVNTQAIQKGAEYVREHYS